MTILNYFLEENHKFWSSYPSPSSKKIIVLDLFHNVHFYLFANCVVAKYIQQLCGGEIVGVLADDFGGVLKVDVEANKNLARSFGINRFCNISELRSQFLSDRVWTEKTECYIRERLGSKSGALLREAVRSLSTPNAPRCGPLVYNEYLRRFGFGTINHVTEELITTAKIVLADYEVVPLALKDSPISASVMGHICYSVWGQVADFSASKGGPVYLVDQYIPIAISRFRNLADLSLGFPHDGKMMMEDYARHARLLSDSRLKSFDNRVEDSLAQTIDSLIGRAQTGRAQLPREAFLKGCGVDPKKATVCVFAHAFQDAPLTRSKQLSDDYWQAVVDVVNVIKQLPHINLVIKPHPRNEAYDIRRSWDELKGYCSGIQNVGFVDGALSAGEVMQHCDAGVSVRGTVLYEMAAAGYRMIATGEDKFSDLDIVETASSLEGLKAILLDIKQSASSIPLARRWKALSFSYCMLQGFRSKSIFVPDKRLSVDDYFNSAALSLFNSRLEEDPLFKNLITFLQCNSPMLISPENFPNVNTSWSTIWGGLRRRFLAWQFRLRS